MDTTSVEEYIHTWGLEDMHASELSFLPWRPTDVGTRPPLITQSRRSKPRVTLTIRMDAGKPGSIPVQQCVCTALPGEVATSPTALIAAETSDTTIHLAIAHAVSLAPFVKSTRRQLATPSLSCANLCGSMLLPRTEIVAASVLTSQTISYAPQLWWSCESLNPPTLQA